MEKWQMIAVFGWPDDNGGRYRLRARFGFQHRPTTEKIIERIVRFQEGYPSPNEVEVLPPTLTAPKPSLRVIA